MNWSEEQYQEYLKNRGIKTTDDKEPKKSKYNAHRIKVDGICFDSQKEANYYEDLKLQLRAGVIKGFCRQCEFILSEGTSSVNAVRYIADFIVFHLDGTAEIVDTKGFKTETYKIKKRLFESKFDLKITEA